VSRFTAHLDVRLLQDDNGRPILRDGRPQWIVQAALRYHVGAEDSAEVIAVPAGFVSDFASIPRLLWRFEPPGGVALKASVIHDYLYAMKGVVMEPPDRLLKYTRADADAIFSEAMAALGVPAFKRAVMFAGVRLGGAGGWGR